MSGLSFKEASAWTSASVTALVFVPFFVKVISAPQAEIWPILVPAVIAATAWQILLHIVLAIRKPPEPILERDRMIGAKARHIASSIMIVGLCVVVGQSLFPAWLGRLPLLGDFPPRALLINLVMLTFVVADLTKCTTQIVLYRRHAWLSAAE